MASTLNNASISALNTALRTMVNAREGFRTAARHVQDEDLQTLFNTKAQHRASMAAQLEDMIREAGGTPTSSDSLAGKAHRSWMNVRARITGHDDATILQECMRGEEHAVEVLGNVLDHTLPHHYKETLQEFLTQIRDDVTEIEERLSS